MKQQGWFGAVEHIARGAKLILEKAYEQVESEWAGRIEKGEKKPLELQSVVVKKGPGIDSKKAKKIAARFGDKTSDIDETSTSFRFRQAEPSLFEKNSYVNQVVSPRVTLVLAKRKKT